MRLPSTAAFHSVLEEPFVFIFVYPETRCRNFLRNVGVYQTARYYIPKCRRLYIPSGRNFKLNVVCGISVSCCANCLPVFNVSHWQRWHCQGNCTALRMRLLFANIYTFSIASELVCAPCVYTIVQLTVHGLCTPVLMWFYKLVQGNVAWYFRSLKTSSYSAQASLPVLAARLRLLQITVPVAWFP